MVVFLSSEWIAAVADAVAGVAIDPGAGDGAVVQVVEAGDREVRTRLVVAGGRATFDDGAPAFPGVPETCVRCDYATAAALAAGTTNAQTELAAGRLRLSGDIRAVAAIAAASAEIAAATAPIRDRTDFGRP